MSLVTLLPFIVLIGAMFLMTRSAKKKQQQAASMRDEMQPGSGVRTIGGMYATVKEVNEETVLLDAAPGVDLLFAKNAIGAVLSDDEYNRIVHGIEHDLKADGSYVPDDASSLTETDEPAADAASDASDDKPLDLGKKDAPAAPAAPADEAAEAKADPASDVEASEPKKTDGEADAK
ncbi:preprotein translocase subunit YajC [Streptomyces sp. NPDC048566]|uniref:preprotein translocase subunit YajC n=1 Tax=Streptomyces sp. NPDC048566 TaxID=3365569 RepID=UPI00371620D0